MDESDQALCVAFFARYGYGMAQCLRSRLTTIAKSNQRLVVGAARSKFCSLALLAGLPLGLGTDHSRCDTLQANSTASCISRVLSSTAVSTGAQPETVFKQATIGRFERARCRSIGSESIIGLANGHSVVGPRV